VVRPSKLIIYENPKILDAGCSSNGFVIDFYIKISKLVICTTYNHVTSSLKSIAKSLMVTLRNLERRMVLCQVAWRFGRSPKDWQIDHLHTQKE